MPFLTKAERVALILRRLENEPACISAPQAYAQIERVINAVEDEHSGVPLNPDAWEDDGRLYMPKADNATEARGYGGVTRYRSVGHWTYVAPNGAFMIQIVADKSVVLDRPGADGRHVAGFAQPESGS